MEKLRQFLAGERDFDDAMTVEDYILPVDVLPDGYILDEDGNCFGKNETRPAGEPRLAAGRLAGFADLGVFAATASQSLPDTDFSGIEPLISADER
jgi:hypothetical protein